VSDEVDLDAQLARAAADREMRLRLASRDSYLGSLKLAGEIWLVACLFIGIYVFFVFEERADASSTTIAGLALSFPVAILAALPGMWLSVAISRLRRTPERRVLARVTRRDGGVWGRRVEIATADGAPAWVVPRFKAFVDGASGSTATGTIAVAVLHGDMLVDWFPYAGRRPF